MLIAVMTGQTAFNLILCGVLRPQKFYYEYNNICVYQLIVEECVAVFFFAAGRAG